MKRKTLVSVEVSVPTPLPAASAQSLGLPSTLMPVRDYGKKRIPWPWQKRDLKLRLEAAERALEQLT